MRRVHCTGRRRGGPLVPDVRRPGRRRGRGDRRGTGSGRRRLSPVQRAFREAHGLQCGFCTPGFVVSLTAYLRDHPAPGDDGAPRRAVREPVPVYRLSGHHRRGPPGRQGTRRGGPVSGRRGRRPVSSASPCAGRRIRGCSPAAAITSTTCVVPGMLHAAFVRSDVARACSAARHSQAARARRASYAVLTASRSEPRAGPMWPTMMGPDVPAAPLRPLADADVRFAGDPIAS